MISVFAATFDHKQMFLSFSALVQNISEKVNCKIKIFIVVEF